LNDCILPAGITALACAIASEIDDAKDIALLAALLTQLGDTLTTIAAQRAVCAQRTPPLADTN
jgi:hypothetical protein